jgi:5'-3' exonuclease
MLDKVAITWDTNAITPGTQFMDVLNETLNAKLNETSNDAKIIYSGSDECGEGEHKIFQWLRKNPTQNITIYGLDADLVLIAIAQRQVGNIQLLRELESKFYTFSIPALVNVLPLEADAFVELCVRCFGNDFMPNLAAFSLREGGYERAIQTGGHITNETEVLMKHTKDKCRRVVAVDGHELETRFGLHLMDGVLDWEPVVYAFRKTCAWTLHYFKTSEVLDWNWVYPYPEAPLLVALDSYDAPESFTWTAPDPTMTIEDQLRFILPSASLRRAGLEPVYEDELYDEEKETRVPWMRRFAWECDPYISLPSTKLTSVSEIRLPAYVTLRVVG